MIESRRFLLLIMGKASSYNILVWELSYESKCVIQVTLFVNIITQGEVPRVANMWFEPIHGLLLAHYWPITGHLLAHNWSIAGP